MTRRGPWRKGIATVGALGMAILMASPAQAATSSGSVSDPIISGLIGPLGLDVSANGTIYVAESFSGQLTRVLPDGTRSVLYQAQGTSPEGVAASFGRVVITLSVAPEQGPATDTQLVQVKPDGTSRVLASLLDYEVANNPDAGTSYGFLGLSPGCLAKLPPLAQPYTGIVESNPYKVATLGVSSYAVADAAGNDILKVTNGVTSTVAVLPSIPQKLSAINAFRLELPPCAVGATYNAEPVPTDVEVGPDGNWYVSSLPGGAESPGSGSVFRINPDTGDVTLVATGFTGAVDLAISKDGTIYVAEISGNRISSIKNGVVSKVVNLFSPGALAFGPDGTLYATTGVFGPAGDVVIVTP